MITLDTMFFQGISGTIQKSKPIFEPIYALGGDEVYIQRLRTEPKQSQISLWQTFATYDEAKAQEREMAAIVGLVKAINVDGLEIYSKFIVLDYTYAFKVGAGGKVLARYEVTCLADLETDNSTPEEPGD